VGDAAGLLDLYRGVGMDAAALSGRLAALSIMDALEGKEAALVRYKHRTRRLVSMIEENARKQEARYASDEALEDSLSPGNIIKGRVDMFWAQILNRLRKPEEMRLLPP
jgi:flavin-dependent dehydrogenase